MADLTAPYSPAQLRAARASLPQRGLLCHVCGLRVPQFVALKSPLRRRIIWLINQRRPLMAAAELRAAISCPERWARLWVLHKGRPGRRRPGPPCRHCRTPLQHSRSSRCLICGTAHLYEAQAHPEHRRHPVDRGARCYPL